jgi:hypothetical protein
MSIGNAVITYDIASQKRFAETLQLAHPFSERNRGI